MPADHAGGSRQRGLGLAKPGAGGAAAFRQFELIGSSVEGARWGEA